MKHFKTSSDHRLVKAKVEINSELECRKRIQNQQLPSDQIIKGNMQKYQMGLKIRLSYKKMLSQMDMNMLKTKVRTYIKTASQRKKSHQTKISKKAKDLMNKRKMMKYTSEYNDLNKAKGQLGIHQFKNTSRNITEERVYSLF